MHWGVVTYVLIIDFIAIMSPGPDFFMVLKNSVSHSIRAGIYTTFGVAVGSTIAFTLSIFGVGAIITSSKFLFTILKISGSVYLVYLAFKSFFAKTNIKEPNLRQGNHQYHHELMRYFRIGLTCNLTNPKSYMFIVSLSTYLLMHGSAFADGIIVIFASLINTTIWFALVATLFGNVKMRQLFYNQQRKINIVFGCIILYVAFRIITL